MRSCATLISYQVAKAYSPTFKSLVETLEKLSGMETRILLAYELRDKEDLLFFELLKEHNFDYEKVWTSHIENGIQILLLLGPVWKTRS